MCVYFDRAHLTLIDGDLKICYDDDDAVLHSRASVCSVCVHLETPQLSTTPVATYIGRPSYNNNTLRFSGNLAKNEA